MADVVIYRVNKTTREPQLLHRADTVADARTWLEAHGLTYSNGHLFYNAIDLGEFVPADFRIVGIVLSRAGHDYRYHVEHIADLRAMYQQLISSTTTTTT